MATRTTITCPDCGKKRQISEVAFQQRGFKCRKCGRRIIADNMHEKKSAPSSEAVAVKESSAVQIAVHVPDDAVAAGKLWIAVGTLMLLSLAGSVLYGLSRGVSLVQSLGAGGVSGVMLIAFLVAITIAVLFASVFIHVGRQTRYGMARGTMENGVGSIILAVLVGYLAFTWFFRSDVLRAVIAGIYTIMLLLAGLFAIMCREKYKAWRKGRKGSVEANIKRGDAYLKDDEYDNAIKEYTTAITHEPSAEGYVSRGKAYYNADQFKLAQADFERAIKLDPHNHEAHENLAWLLATAPDVDWRHGPVAVTMATRACELTNWKNANYIDTLAAAHAEAGDFKNAVKSAKKALRVGNLDKDDAAGINERLELYAQNQPYREE